jgi:hypothetical protein
MTGIRKQSILYHPLPDPASRIWRNARFSDHYPELGEGAKSRILHNCLKIRRMRKAAPGSGRSGEAIDIAEPENGRLGRENDTPVEENGRSGKATGRSGKQNDSPAEATGRPRDGGGGPDG